MIKLLVYIALFLAAVLIFQLMRIYQLSSEIKGKNIGVANEKDNRSQGRGMLAFAFGFFIFLIWLIIRFKNDLLPTAASDVGKISDNLFMFNWVIIFIVFFITTFLLFYFAFKYHKSAKNPEAYFYPHNDKLELIWTVVPSIVLAVIIIYGLSLWGKLTGKPDANALNVQLYAKQFDFTVRYSGADNQLGTTNYKMIDDASNPLGMDSTDPKGLDDIVVKGEMHMPVGREINIQCNARDVMHGMYFPHFRDQINCVPGMSTYLHFTPTITTDSMRLITHDTGYNYILICNRVCGAGHYNMFLKVVVDTKEEFEKWMATKKPQFDAMNKRRHGATAVSMK
ncbi:MAG TPA: cytochrome c oxidase subunit II [Bacteroidia bacterium]|nr:cytochrome c oxidase subunit II [Bacteroidia bacterium]